MEERIYIDPKEMLKGFDDGINCAMCVFGTMAPKLGFNREEARQGRGAHRRRDGALQRPAAASPALIWPWAINLPTTRPVMWTS